MGRARIYVLLMMCVLFVGCDEDQLLINRTDNVTKESVNQVTNQTSDIVTPELPTYIMFLFGLTILFMFSDWSYRFKVE